MVKRGINKYNTLSKIRDEYICMFAYIIRQVGKGLSLKYLTTFSINNRVMAPKIMKTFMAEKNYSQTCEQRSPRGDTEYGFYRQMVFI